MLGYAFDEGVGTEAAEVAGGASLTGVPGWAEGRHGQAMRLNLQNGPEFSPFAVSGPFTVMFDLYVVGLGNNGYNIVFQDFNTGGTFGNVQVGPTGVFDWYGGTGTAGDYAVPTSAWVNVALTGSGTQRKAYMDGSPIATVANTVLSGANVITLGGFAGYEPNVRMDNLRILDAASTDGEIAALAGTPVLPETSESLWWWDGADKQPVNQGWWDGSAVQPLTYHLHE